MDRAILGGRLCYYTKSSIPGAPVVFCGISSEHGDYREETGFSPLTGIPADFLFFETEDWDGDFSPWPAEMLLSSGPSRVFPGGGRKTLDWMIQYALPFAEERYGKGKRFLAGYSLAGLWAMWAFYESGAFDGVVSASASFWYEGWETYMAGAALPDDGRIRHAYLSLGGKEPRAKNPVMASIGEAYERQKLFLKKDPALLSVTFEWNPGGHFGNDMERLAKGIRWLLTRNWCKIEPSQETGEES